ncbi:hypothetical protein [Burkholderia cenocepacia]|uniref:hypothetical protein n=1 Tax=Burkholderia cenocepacia TaxID=95486 RepID=UPI0005B7D5F3|nr:hypothetical protein [Burkholderia cenocepacia]
MAVIYEPLYEQGQSLSEPAFKPLRLADNPVAWREFRILVDFYRRGDHKNADKTGIFSPKFGLKTQVPAQRFIEFADANRDADVCLINPFPQLRYYSYNVWMQGEANHPGLCERTQNLLSDVGLDWDLASTPRHDERVLCYSNFWVGSEAFWEGYVGDVLNRIANHIERHAESAAVRAVMGDTYHTDAAPFLPFIVERLFSTFLSLNPAIKVAAYPLPDLEPYLLTDYEREMVRGIAPIVDAADRAESFPVDLIQIQQTFCRLAVMYGHEYFKSNMHPHSGKSISRE